MTARPKITRAKRASAYAPPGPGPMSGAELIGARVALGMTAAALGRALGLQDRDPGRTVRLWEEGRPIPGPARVAVRYMLADHARAAAPEPATAPLAVPTSDPSPAPPKAAQSPDSQALAEAPPERPAARIRRRGPEAP